MKTSPSDSLRLNFSPTPRSISHRLRELTGKTAGELLRLLCELTVGFRKSSIDRSYRQLAKTLGKSVETIARAAKFLLRSGDLIAEARPGCSYRWTVPLEAKDILSDRAGICTVRSASVTVTESSAQATPKAYPTNDEVAPTKAISSALELALKSDSIPAAEPERPHTKTSDADPNRENDVLLKRLANIKMERKVAKNLVETGDHALIIAALDNLKGRSNIKNKAGYVLSEVRAGGYLNMQELAADSFCEPVCSQKSEAPTKYRSPEQSRAEMQAVEAERVTKQQKFNQELAALQERGSQLADNLRTKLRDLCQRHLAQLVPSTSSREQLLESSAYKKIAFKETMEQFFSLIDQGFKSEEALAELAF